MSQVSYSEGFRRQAVQKMYSRGDRPLSDLVKELGCSSAALYRWANTMKSPVVAKSSSQWTVSERLSAILEFAALAEAEQGVWLRSNGLTSELIEAWKEAVSDAFEPKKQEAGLGRLRKENKSLEHQLRRKDRKLHQLELVIDMQKKIFGLLQDNQDESPELKTGKS